MTGMARTLPKPRWLWGMQRTIEEDRLSRSLRLAHGFVSIEVGGVDLDAAA